MQNHWGTEEGGCRSEGANISKTTKLRVYNAIVKPTLLYGSETWTLQNRHMKKLQATEMRYLGKVEGVTRMGRMTSDDIRERLRQTGYCAKKEETMAEED